MKRKFAYLFGLSGLAVISGLLSLACQNKGPGTPYDLSFTPTPTQIVHITGSVNAFVQDKGLAVPGLLVQAIPPSAVTVFSQATTTSGIATFNPPYLEVGNWTFVVPAQTPFPFAPSTITMPVSVANETANFNSAGVTMQMTPPVPAAYTGTNGGVFVYGLSYTQPGSLLVPVKLAFPAFPTNWSGSYGPATFGYVSNDTASVTISGASCVDQPLSFAVTARDLEPTPFPRTYSTPQTVTKNFTSTMTVTWYSPNFSNISSCNVEKTSNVGTLTVTSSNSCAVAYVSITEPSTNCYSGSWQTPNGNTSAQNAGGGSIAFSPGTYSCKYISDGGFPTFYATCSGNGTTGNVQVNNGTFTILNTSY